MGVLIFGHASNVADAKTAYLTMNTKGKVTVTYDHGDNYSLDVYVPPCSTCPDRHYRERLYYFSDPSTWDIRIFCVFTRTLEFHGD